MRKILAALIGLLATAASATVTSTGTVHKAIMENVPATNSAILVSTGSSVATSSVTVQNLAIQQLTPGMCMQVGTGGAVTSTNRSCNTADVVYTSSGILYAGADGLPKVSTTSWRFDASSQTVVIGETSIPAGGLVSNDAVNGLQRLWLHGGYSWASNLNPNYLNFGLINYGFDGSTNEPYMGSTWSNTETFPTEQASMLFAGASVNQRAFRFDNSNDTIFAFGQQNANSGGSGSGYQFYFGGAGGFQSAIHGADWYFEDTAQSGRPMMYLNGGASGNSTGNAFTYHRYINFSTSEDSFILDHFGGVYTTGHSTFTTNVSIQNLLDLGVSGSGGPRASFDASSSGEGLSLYSDNITYQSNDIKFKTPFQILYGNIDFGTPVGFSFAVKKSSCVPTGSSCAPVNRWTIDPGATTRGKQKFFDNTGTQLMALAPSGADVNTSLVVHSTGAYQGMVTFSSAPTSTDSLYLAGALSALPTTGYSRGTLAVLISNMSLYISTETVVGTFSWIKVGSQ